MDIIQETVLIFRNLIQRLKSIGELLKSTSVVEEEDSNKGLKLFWIFNW